MFCTLNVVLKSPLLTRKHDRALALAHAAAAGAEAQDAPARGATAPAGPRADRPGVAPVPFALPEDVALEVAVLHSVTLVVLVAAAALLDVQHAERHAVARGRHRVVVRVAALPHLLLVVAVLEGEDLPEVLRVHVPAGGVEPRLPH